MTMMVYRADNLEVLKASFNCLYDIWLEVAQDKEQGQIFSIREVQTKLDDIMRKRWKVLQDVFLNDGFHGYNKGSFTNEEETMHAKMVMDLVKKTDEVFQSLRTRIDEIYIKDKAHKDELTALQNENLRLSGELSQSRWKQNQCQTDSTNASGRIAQLEQINKEKTDLIAQLQRDATVELWEKEKRKILEKAKLDNAGMLEQVQQLEKEKAMLRERLRDVEMEMKKSKLAVEMKNRNTNRQEIDEHKQYAFLLAKDLKKLDEQLFTQQKITVGLLAGLRRTFELPFEKYRGRAKLLEEDDRDQFQLVEDILAQSRDAAAQGTLEEYVQTLDREYQARDSDVINVICRKISNNFTGRLTPLPNRRISRLSISIPNNQPLLSPLDSSRDNQTPQKKTSENPQLISKVTGNVNMIQVLRHFPFLLKEDIEALWKKFLHYDRNGDGTLDLAEVMVAISSEYDNRFTATQIREAMLEVDADDSEDLDFFEFVTVANLLKNRAGRSELYRHKDIQAQGKVSKMCSVM